MNTHDIAARLKVSPPFRGWEVEDLARLAETVQVVTYQPGEVIFRQGDAGQALYVVESGRVEQIGLDAEGREIIRRTLVPGDTLGRHALLLDGPQPTTATSQAATRLIALPPQVLSWLLNQDTGLRDALLHTDIARRLRAFPCFRSLSDDAVRRLADLVHPMNIPAGSDVAEAGDLVLSLFLIDWGQIEVRTPGEGTLWLTAGHTFGGQSPAEGTSPSRAVAHTRAALFFLPEADFRHLLKTYPTVGEDLQPPKTAARLQGIPLFSDLTSRHRSALAGYIAWESHPKGHLVTSQGDEGQAFYILNRGEAVARLADRQEQQHTRFYPGNAFGETSLFLGDTRDASVEATTDSDWLKLNRSDFQVFLGRFPDAWERLHPRPDIEERLRAKRFAWQEEGELVHFWARRHWFFLARRALLPVALVLFLVGGLSTAISDPAPPWFDALFFILIVAAILAVLWALLDWSNDFFVISNRRISHQERVLLISEKRVEAPLDKVQDIAIRRGLLGQIFGFGHLAIQTAATVGMITFDHVAEPEWVQEVIFDQAARMRASRRGASKGAIRQRMEQNLAGEMELQVPERALPMELPPAERPRRVRWYRRLRLLPWLRKQEDDRIIWRKHWLNLLVRTWRPLLAVLLTAAGMLAVLSGVGPFAQMEATRSPVFLVLLLLFFSSLAWLWWNYDDWGNDIYIVTDDRIIDVEKKPLFFSENRREASLAMVQNVSFDIPGPVAYLLNYGNVVIQTAAERGMLDFRFVSNPREVQNEIFRRIERYRQRETADQENAHQAELLEWFDEYSRLRR